MNNPPKTNRAKLYQLALFPLNNGATNVYFVLILSYIANFGSNVLGLALTFATLMVTAMRVFDAITDPLIGALMDRTNGRFGKFRPFMVIGNGIMAVSVFLLYVFTPMVTATWARYALFVILYGVWVIGYTFQTSVTRAAQPVLTDDPKQRPLFTIFNTVGSLAGMGLIQGIGPILAGDGFLGDYNGKWYVLMTVVGVVISFVLTILAVIGIWEKDNAKYFGLGGGQEQKMKLSEYVAIIRGNQPLQRLMIAGGGCKLAQSIANNMTVLIMLYACMMGNYDGLYLPLMVAGFVFAAPFFGLTVKTAQKHGQKKSLMTYVAVALISYTVVLILLLLWRQGSPEFSLRLYEITDGNFRISTNLYTILFVIFYSIGYGAYYATADMPIPMVADCADYETYKTGKFIPGIMGTLFSLVDKLVSSLSGTVVGLAVGFIGFQNLPTKATPYVPGMNYVVIVLFCVIPMVSWVATLLAMRKYALTGERMKTIHKVNTARRAAIAAGMSQQEAMTAITDETV
ncbi:MAG: sugar transporter [Ruminococcaceae bacterium]|nr:sugar transporter [Oscillospiraceae bacterium]